MATQVQKIYTLINPQDAAKISDRKPDTLKRLRRQGDLIEGVHWVRENNRRVKYRKELLEDWAATRHDTHRHLAAIEEFERHQKARTSIDRLAPA
jgi:hypothetical protein